VAIPETPRTADSSALTAPETSEQEEAHANTFADQLSISEKTHIIESFLAQNPGVSIALGVTELMHKMRELFVDIAILEGKDRGIHVEEEGDEEYLLEQADIEDNAGLGLQLESQTRVMDTPSSVTPDTASEEELLQFSLDLDMEDQLLIPGQFAESISEESTRPEEHVILTQLNPLVNPYAAISISAVLATLFVVGVVVGRHHYLRSQQEMAQDDAMEKGDGSISDSPTNPNEKPLRNEVHPDGINGRNGEEEINEKVNLELHPSVRPDDASGDQEAAQSLALLIDVANAALSSSTNPTSILKNTGTLGSTTGVLTSATTTSSSTTTPKLVANALESIQAEMGHTPLTKQVVPRSQPQTPRSITPALRIIPAASGLPERVTGSGSVAVESAASSYASDRSMIRVSSPYPILPRSTLRVEDDGSRSTISSPTPSYVTAQTSPASSFTTAQEPSTPIHRAISTLNRPFSPQLRVPGSLMLYEGDTSMASSSSMTTEDDIGEVNILGMMTRNRDGGMGRVPPARITQTALDLALMLPATEWIFQFIVVFIGWFGFLMRPVPTKTRIRRD
jgi:hypothetical protein